MEKARLIRKIEVYEKGLDKKEKELRFFRYPSQNYKMTIKHINQIKEVLVRMKKELIEIEKEELKAELKNELRLFTERF